MLKQIFINLPVEDVEKSMNFYIQLGFSNKALFSDDQQKCMVWTEQIYVMLQSKEFFSSFTKKPIPDTKNNLAATFTLPVESLDRVNEIIESGLKAGGREPTPMLDEGFMQVRCIEDLDGHTWGVIYLDLSKFRKEQPAE
jgi:predicted lactoylglutathione lyase